MLQQKVAKSNKKNSPGIYPLKNTKITVDIGIYSTEHFFRHMRFKGQIRQSLYINHLQQFSTPKNKRSKTMHFRVTFIRLIKYSV
jgi:hypothetical protein